MDAALLARLSALGRLGFGVGLITRPALLTQAWIGRDALRAGPQVLTRALGTRDLVLGAGTLATRGREQQRWLLAALAADGTDLAVSAADPGLPLRGRLIVSLAAGTGVAMGIGALAGLRQR
jgi:hypothetical protein